jgi:hypothetical protein
VRYMAGVKWVLVLAIAIGLVVPAAASAAEDPFAEGCPAETLEEGATAGLEHNPAAKKSIVPAGATSLRICRYWGFGNEKGQQTPKTQARAGELNDQAEVRNKALLEGLTYEFKELEAAPKGTINCPSDDGTELYAVFFYAHAQPVIVHVALSGCRFASAAVPRAREMTASLEHKLVRLAKGEHVKAAPKHGEVKEKGVAERPPLRLTRAVAEHDVRSTLKVGCDGNCKSSTVTGCVRKTAKIFRCAAQAITTAGEKCHAEVTVREVEYGIASQELGEGSGGPRCRFILYPPELRESVERNEREEAQEGKRSNRATGQSAKRTSTKLT